MVSNRQFSSHGYMHLSLEPPLLLIQGQGPWNMEMMLKYQRDVQAFREKLCHRRWASLVRLSGETLLPAEAESMMVDTINAACEINLIATAVVLIDAEFPIMVKEHWQSVYRQTPIKFGFFECEAVARVWLSQQLDEAEATAGIKPKG